MLNYKLFDSANSPDDLERKALDFSVSDILLDQRKGCHLDLIIEPRNDWEKGQLDRGHLIKKTLALNYGPEGDFLCNFYVYIYSPEAIQNQDRNGPIFVLDNAYDDKTFFKIMDDGFRSVFLEGDKVISHFTFLGDVNDIFNELKESGYVFSDKPFQVKDHWERREKIEILYKKNNIYHSKFNPNPQE